MLNAECSTSHQLAATGVFLSHPPTPLLIVTSTIYFPVVQVKRVCVPACVYVCVCVCVCVRVCDSNRKREEATERETGKEQT